MRIVPIVLMIALFAAFLSAQEETESVQSVLEELDRYQNPEPPAETPPVIIPVETPELVVEETIPVAEVFSEEEEPIWIEEEIVDIDVQEETESVQSILEELDGYQNPETPEEMPPAIIPVEIQEFVVEKTVPVAEIFSEVEEEPLWIEKKAAEVDVEEWVEESRDYYVGGEFARAQAGFEKVVQVAPENTLARIYLRKLLERDQRTAEVSGMEAVSTAWDTSLVLRSYPVSSDDLFKMGLRDAEGSVNVEVKFPEVDFPEGASALYQPTLGKLFVRNTRDNLLVLEEILDAMEVSQIAHDVQQVEIEAKFVEVSEGTLEELGFEWRTAGADINLFDGVNIPDGNYLFPGGLRGGATGPASAPGSPLPMPFSRPDTLGKGSDSAGGGDWTATRFEDTFNEDPGYLTIHRGGHIPLDVVMSALDQSSGADVLSAPRVVTKSGEEATIRVGQLHTYPEVYEVGASGGNIVHVKYEDWEERLLGIELNVTPQLDGEMTELGLNPKITELQGWQNYDVAPADSSYTWYQYRLGLQFNHDAIVARLPIFRVREIETEVTIADGATLMMGGLINEKVESFEDKVPILGSIPLVGRLFRNEGERAIKRNLMMFVTAKRVEPTGRINSSRSFE